MTMGLLLGSVFCGSEVASRTQGKRSPIIRGSKCRSYPKTTLSVLLYALLIALQRWLQR